MSETAPEVVDGDAEGLSTLQVQSLFDDEEQDRILEAASARAESPAAFLRDAVLDRVADAIGEEGHLECWVDGCQETYTSERRRRGHVGRVHSDNLPEGDFWCGICGYGPTTYPGVGAHHGQRHTGEDVRPLDHEPDRDELLAPDDVPDHMDRELLERLYYECDGSYTEMCRRHEFDVTPGRVRHYLIEYGIHEPTPQGEGGDDHPVYRDRDWLKERYDAAGGNLSEMHRNLEIDVPYRTLVKNVNRYDFHDPTDPPGKHHGKGGPKPSTSTEPDVGQDEEPDDVQDEADDVPTGEGSDLGDLDYTDPVDLQAAYDAHDSIKAAAEAFPDVSYATVRQYLIDEGIHQPQRYDTAEGTASDPTPNDEEGSVEEDVPELGPLDVDDPADLRRAYAETDTIAEAAVAFPDASYGVVRRYLIDHGIHVPESQRTRVQEPDVRADPPRTDDVDDEPDLDEEPPGPPIEWDFEPGFQTVAEQEEDSHNRLVEDANCVRCGEPYEGDGVCPSCSEGVVEDLVTDGGTVQIEGHCPCCGTPYGPGDYRCEGELPDGTRCGKDLVEEGGRR